MAERPRVLVMDLHRSFLGAQRVLVDALAGSGDRYDLVVLTAGEPRLGVELGALGIAEVALPMPDAMAAVTRRRPPSPAAVLEAVRYLRAVRRAVARIAPDAVIANTPKAHVIAALALSRALPLGARLHDVMPPSPHVRLLVRLLLARRTDSVSCVSGAVRRSAIGLGYADARTVSFPNGAPEMEAAPPAGGAPIVTVVGQLEPWKGQDIVVRAFARTSAAFPEARLRVVGRPVKGPAFARFLRGIAADLGITGRVGFEEGLTGVGEIYGGAHLLVHAPVQADPLPTVILEAMALGIPVVATAVGGIPEMVIDGETGLLVPPGDVEALSAAISRILADPAGAATMGATGRERAQEQFSRTRYLSEQARWIDGLIGIPAHSGPDENGRGSDTDVAILESRATE